jgi:hypothetical protein
MPNGTPPFKKICRGAQPGAAARRAELGASVKRAWLAGSKRSPSEMTPAASKALPANQQATSRTSSVGPETARGLRIVFGAVHPTGPRSTIVEFTSTRTLVHAQKWSGQHCLCRLDPATRGLPPEHGYTSGNPANPVAAELARVPTVVDLGILAKSATAAFAQAQNKKPRRASARRGPDSRESEVVLHRDEHRG